MSSGMWKITLFFLIPGLFELTTRLTHRVKSLEKKIFLTNFLTLGTPALQNKLLKQARNRAEWSVNAQMISPKFEPAIPRTTLH